MIADLKKNTEAKMHKSVEAFKADLAKVRTGRAHPGILDHVLVDYYGAQTPLNQVAKISLIDGRTIGVSPFEKKLGQAIEKAIRANAGLIAEKFLDRADPSDESGADDAVEV